MHACPRLWEIDPYREGRLGTVDAKSFERHVLTCEVCGTQLKRDERLAELASELPNDGPTELALRRLRRRVLRDAATGDAPPPASRRLRAVMASLVVVIGVGIGVSALLARHMAPSPDSVAPATRPSIPPEALASTRPRDEAPRTPPIELLAGAVVPSAQARWSQSRAQGVERIVLDDGLLRLHVRPQVAGERFLVTLPDGELEVRGTTFEVGVAQGATRRVHVDDGVVELRLRGRVTLRLGAGETWNVATPASSAALPAGAAASAPVDSAVVAQAGAAYAAAIALLSDGRNDEAASAFHALVLSQPSSAQADDASFLEAVALARMGRSDAAALAAEHHLASFPASFHRKDAAILVARAAAHRGDCGKARALLAPWTGQSPDAEAQATLRNCPDR